MSAGSTYLPHMEHDGAILRAIETFHGRPPDLSNPAHLGTFARVLAREIASDFERAVLAQIRDAGQATVMKRDRQ